MDDLETAVRRTKPVDLQAKLEPYFIPVSGVNLPSGRVFFPREYISIKDLIVSVLPQIESHVEWDTDFYESFADELFDSYGLDEILEWVARDAGSWVVHCWQTDSRLSGDSGIMKFSLENRGYLYHRPDSGVGEDESLRILGSWEPVEDEEAFKVCFLRTYLREWDHVVLPPKVSQWVTGPVKLMKEAVSNILKDDPEAWRWVIDKLQEDVGKTTITAELIHEFVSKTGLPSERVEQVLQFSRTGGKELREKFLRKKVNRDAFLDMFWALVTPNRED